MDDSERLGIMGLFGSLRKKFDNGGIGLRLDLPSRFRWEDGEIPATVTVTGHKSEPRTIHGLHFVVRENETSDDSSSSSNTGSTYFFEHMWRRNDTIELAAGKTEQFTITIPLPELPQKDEFEEQAFGREASGFLEKAFVVAARGASPTAISRFLITVSAHADGASRPKRANRHIRQGRG